MTKNMAHKWTQSFASLRNDERGAEATEVIFILVIVVLGLAAGFIALVKVLNGRNAQTKNCLQANSSC